MERGRTYIKIAIWLSPDCEGKGYKAQFKKLMDIFKSTLKKVSRISLHLILKVTEMTKLKVKRVLLDTGHPVECPADYCIVVLCVHCDPHVYTAHLLPPPRLTLHGTSWTWPSPSFRQYFVSYWSGGLGNHWSFS